MSGQYGRRDQIKSEVVKKGANFSDAYASPEPSDRFPRERPGILSLSGGYVLCVLVCD